MVMNEEKNTGLRALHDDAEIGLRSVQVNARLSGLVAQVAVRQVYRNWSDRNVECVYTFPLGWQSVLLGMRVELNGKRLTGAVKPKKVAEADYERGIDSGDLPVMLERSGKDLYTANIGNLQPGDEVVIELDYAQVLQLEDGAVRWRLPTTIAPRYGDSAEAGLRPHQDPGVDAQAEHRLFVNLTLAAPLSAGSVYSPTHDIRQQHQGEECHVRLEGTAWLDRDFVLVVDRVGDMSFAVAAPDPTRMGEATMLVGSVWRPTTPPRRRPLALKVLVDCSGSMQGDSIAQARDCLHWLFGQLGSEDLASFTRFGSHVQHEHGQLQPCSLLYRQSLKSAARRLQADLGGTELEAALQATLAIQSYAPKESPDAAILLITDGDVWAIENTVATVRQAGQRIYAVGVGSAPANSLLQDLAEVSGGACEIVSPGDNMHQAVERLLQHLRQSQAVKHDFKTTATILWDTVSHRHARPGQGVCTWAQIQNPQSPDPLQLVQALQPEGTATRTEVHWDEQLQLPRIAAALRIRELSDAKAREALALQYQLVSAETNLILVHERAEAEQAEDLPELVQVRPMLAAGWGGNGTVAKAQQIQMREHRDVSFKDNRNMRSAHIDWKASSHSVPAVWRTSHMSARTGPMDASGMDDIEIPAFLRKISDSGGNTAPPPTPAQPKPEHAAAPGRPASTQNPQIGPETLAKVLQTPMRADHPVLLLVHDFNRTALHHTQFRSALAEVLRQNPAGYLQWLVTRHMGNAGSAAPIWAIFIVWAAETYTLNLDRHAQRLLRDFMAGMNEQMAELVRGELEDLKEKESGTLTSPITHQKS